LPPPPTTYGDLHQPSQLPPPPSYAYGPLQPAQPGQPPQARRGILGWLLALGAFILGYAKYAFLLIKGVPALLTLARRDDASLIMLPVLTVINDFVGIFGGNIIAKFYLGLPTAMYWRTVFEQMLSGGFTLRYIPNDFIQGLIKPFVFGGIISLIACYHGLKTTGGTEGVGLATTRTVVAASILILVVDYFLTQVLLAVFTP